MAKAKNAVKKLPITDELASNVAGMGNLKRKTEYLKTKKEANSIADKYHAKNKITRVVKFDEGYLVFSE
jgi:nitrogen regulatory protein PII